MHSHTSVKSEPHSHYVTTMKQENGTASHNNHGTKSEYSTKSENGWRHAPRKTRFSDLTTDQDEKSQIIELVKQTTQPTLTTMQLAGVQAILALKQKRYLKEQLKHIIQQEYLSDPQKVLNDDSSAAATTNGSADTASDQQPTKKRSRWASKPAVESTSTADPSLLVACGITTEQYELEKKRLLITELTDSMNNMQEFLQRIDQLKAGANSNPYQPQQRSPSPEPTYNDRGQRTNTREQRYKDKLFAKRDKIIAELMKVDPQYRPPNDSSFAPQKMMQQRGKKVEKR